MAAQKPKKEPWTRAHKLQVAALLVGILSVIAGYCYFHFKASSPQQSGTQMNGTNRNVNQGGTQINNGGNGTVINNSPGATVNQSAPDLAQKIAEAEDQKYFGELVPGNDPFPKLPGEVPTNGVMLLLGNSVNVVRSFPHTVVMWRDQSVLKISTNSQGASVSAKFFDKNGNIVADLEDNRFHINRLNSFMLERPNKSTVKVRDLQDFIVLDVQFMNPKLIKLNALFRFPDGQETIISESSGFFSSPSFLWDNVVDVEVP